MEESLTLQALRLDMPGDFDDHWARTTSYVKGLIGRPWWTSVKQLLANEGPLGKMVELCLVYQLEEGDRILGYKAYTSYLTAEYGSNIARNRLTSVDYDEITALEKVAPVPLGDQASTDTNVVEIPDWITEEQADFLTMYTKMGIGPTAEALGITVDQAWGKRRTINAKRRYHADD